MSKTTRKQTTTKTTGKRAAPKPAAEKPNAPRAASKQSQLIAMLRQPDGATIVEITEALGWLPHTARAAIAGALRKKLGLNIASEKDADRGRVYRLTE